MDFWSWLFIVLCIIGLIALIALVSASVAHAAKGDKNTDYLNYGWTDGDRKDPRGN